MSAERVTFALDERTGVARLTLVRVAERNAIDRAFVEELRAAVEQVAAATGRARALLIDADGPSFTVGGDLAHLNGQLDRLSDELVDMIGPYHESLGVLAELPMPVVCAVQGAAAGGGLGLLWSADVVIAADDLKIVTAFSRLGVSGDGGSSWYLPRLLGLRRAQELILESRALDADEALGWGLVTRVVARDELAAEARATVERLATGPTRGLALQRSLLRAADQRSLREGLAAEVDAMRASGATADAAEGMAAFVQRRAPVFRGR